MRTPRFSETEIIYAAKQVEAGISIKEIARKYGICENTVYGGVVEELYRIAR